MTKNPDALREELLKDERVQQMIRARAYEIFERRGRAHGHDLDDWLQAENEILSNLMREASAAKAKSGYRAEAKTKRAVKGSKKKQGREENA